MAGLSSGIVPDDNKVEEWKAAFKRGSKVKYMTFVISSDKTKIELEKTSTEKDYGKFLEDLPEWEPRFVIYQFDYQNDGRTTDKLLFISWSPDPDPSLEGDARREAGRLSFLYTSTQKSFVDKFSTAQLAIQAKELEDISYDEVMARIKRA